MRNARCAFVTMVVIVIGSWRAAAAAEAVPVRTREKPRAGLAPMSAAKAVGAPVKVAVDVPHPRPELKKVFESFEGVQTTFQSRDEWAAMPVEVRDSYDVVIFMSCRWKLTNDKTKEALEHLGSTRQGIILVHQALVDYQKWGVWDHIVGSADHRWGGTHAGNQKFRVDVASAEHPITKGLASYEMVDETNTKPEPGKGCETLLTTEHRPSSKAIAWAHEYKQSRVFCFESGHDAQAWRNPNFGEVLRRGILWCAHRLPGAAEARRTFHVSPKGGDANPGTPDRPFATLAKAQAQVRALVAEGLPASGVTVVLRGGTYYLPQTLVFTPADSGTEKSPVVYASAPGELATLSGGRAVPGAWKPWKDGIHQCTLDEKDVPPGEASVLFVNARRQVRARYPNAPVGHSAGHYGRFGFRAAKWPRTGPEAVESKVWGSFELAEGSQPFTRPKERNWSRVDRAFLHSRVSWNSVHYAIAELEDGRFTLGPGGYQTNQHSNPSGSLYFDNILEELDAPGEWYYDPDTRTLYLKPEEGVDLAKARVEIGGLKTVVAFQGEPGKPVHHVKLEGLRITHTATTFMQPNYAPSQGDWGVVKCGAVMLEGAEDCAVDGCWFDQVGGTGVFVANYARRVRVERCKIVLAGDGGVYLVGSREAAWKDPNKIPWNRSGKGSVPELWQPGGAVKYLPAGHDGATAYHADCVVRGNLIHHTGAMNKQSACVYAAIGERLTIASNLLHSVPRAAICFNDTIWGGHVIENNDIRNTVGETGDHGAFNSWGRDTYGGPDAGGNLLRPQARAIITIRHNRILESGGRGGFGIDLDDGSSMFRIHDNLTVNASLKYRDGRDRVAENNVFVNRPVNFHVSTKNDHFRRNIIYFTRPTRSVYAHAMGGPPEDVDYNVIFTPDGKYDPGCPHSYLGLVKRGEQDPGPVSLAQWQAAGRDTNSVFGDPLFLDPANLDFRLKPASPALKLGFKPFPLDTFGLPTDFRKDWLDPLPPAPDLDTAGR